MSVLLLLLFLLPYCLANETSTFSSSAVTTDGSDPIDNTEGSSDFSDQSEDSLDTIEGMLTLLYIFRFVPDIVN